MYTLIAGLILGVKIFLVVSGVALLAIGILWFSYFLGDLFNPLVGLGFFFLALSLIAGQVAEWGKS